MERLEGRVGQIEGKQTEQKSQPEMPMRDHEGSSLIVHIGRRRRTHSFSGSAVTGDNHPELSQEPQPAKIEIGFKVSVVGLIRLPPVLAPQWNQSVTEPKAFEAHADNR